MIFASADCNFFPGALSSCLLCFEKNVATNPTTNTSEKIKSELPYPPNAVTSIPTNNTAVAVTSLPVLKQKPVAVPRIATGNKAGI